MTVAAFLSIWFLHLMAAVSPGPAVLMSARTGITQGFMTGFWLSVGIGLGGAFWAAAALFGLSLLFEAAPSLLWALKIVGGIYLVRMGWLMWRSADEPLNLSDSENPPRSARSAIVLGITTQIVNPKPAILFSAIFLGTVPQSAPYWVYGALLLIVFLNELIWNVAVARIFSFDKPRRTYLGLKSTIDRVFGGALALLGVKIAAT